MSDDTCVSADKAVIRELLVKHGYNPDLEPQFRSGPPGEFDGYVMAGGEPVPGLKPLPVQRVERMRDNYETPLITPPSRQRHRPRRDGAGHSPG